MKKSIYFLLLYLVFSLPGFASVRVYDVKKQLYLEYNQLIQNLPIDSVIFLGEFHYNPPVQKAEASIINDLVEFNNLKNNFTLSWEFLNYSDQSKIDQNFTAFKNDEILFFDFLKTFNMENALSYAPVFEVIKSQNGELRGINIDRSIKQLLISNGINSLDPKLIPPNYELGSNNYWIRFKESMGNHVPEAKILRYFEAQSFTDSVMSFELSHVAIQPLNFVILGSFHSDYFDGTFEKLKKISDKKLINIKIVNESELTSEEIENLIHPSPQFGMISDFIILTSN